MPQREPSAYVWDVLDCCRLLSAWLSECDRAQYMATEMTRMAVERVLITIGEAMSRLSKVDPAMAAELGDVQQIVAFRNVLVHGYFQIDHAQVWDALTNDLPALHQAAARVWSRFADQYPEG